jgi:hypothetical protein
MTPFFVHTLKDVLACGSVGLVILALPAVAFLFIAAAGLLWRRSHISAGASWIAFGTFVAAIVASAAQIWASRRDFADEVMRHTQVHPSILIRAASVQRFTAGASLLIAPLVTIALTSAWVRSRDERPELGVLSVFVVPVGLLVWITALALEVDACAALAPEPYSCSDEGCRYAQWVGREPSESLRLVLGSVVIVAALTVMSLWVVRPRARATVRALRPVAIVLLAIGTLSFAVTRKAAYDARHAVPLWTAPVWYHGVLDADLLPIASAPCTEDIEGPIVIVAADGALYGNGLRTADVEAFIHAAAAAWASSHHGSLFSGSVYVAAPAATLARNIREALDAVHRAGAPRVRAILRLPPREELSRTLGRLRHEPRVCALPIEPTIDSNEQRTWGDRVLSYR